LGLKDGKIEGWKDLGFGILRFRIEGFEILRL
jgi:hypothetical protein